MTKDGVIETVADFIKGLQQCAPKAKISVKGNCGVVINGLNKKHIYLDVFVK